MINILILSVGTRNKIIQYFRKALTTDTGNRIGNVIVTDMSSIAPAIYEADKFYQVPQMITQGYINVIFDICRKEKVTAILSLIDPEISLLAGYKEEFNNLGVTVIGSNYDICEMSLDKMQMYKWLINHNYMTAKSYTDREHFYQDINDGKVSYPVFVKPVKGSASIAISKIEKREMIELLFDRSDKLMIQEFLNGQEIGVDVYVDMISGETVSIFTKKKLMMRAGETDKAISFKSRKLFELVEKFVKEVGYRGQVDIDIFEVNGEYFISEVNPRFGGGYPHAYECGCDHMKLIVENLLGRANEKNIGCYDDGICMMKYNDVMIKKL